MKLPQFCGSGGLARFPPSPNRVIGNKLQQKKRGLNYLSEICGDQVTTAR